MVTGAELDKLDARCVELIRSREADHQPSEEISRWDKLFRRRAAWARANPIEVACGAWAATQPEGVFMGVDLIFAAGWTAALAHRPAPTDLREAVAAETTHGRVTWHSSDEDGGPDVGLSLGLGDGKALYMGELAKATLAAGGINVEETGDGWWFALVGGGIEPVALIASMDAAREMFDALAGVLVSAPAPRAESFQARVAPWMQECFGPKISADKEERNDRFLEEALELTQASGYTAERAHALVDYTFGRPQGEINQEVGGVMVTLAAHCLAHGVNMHEAGETELRRVWRKIETIREKQKTKPKHSPLPVAPRAVTDADVERVERIILNHYSLQRDTAADAAREILATLQEPRP